MKTLGFLLDLLIISMIIIRLLLIKHKFYCSNFQSNLRKRSTHSKYSEEMKCFFFFLILCTHALNKRFFCCICLAHLLAIILHCPCLSLFGLLTIEYISCFLYCITLTHFSIVAIMYMTAGSGGRS